MVVGQILPRVDDSMHISLHQLSYNVDILVVNRSRRLCHVKDFDNVLVIEEFEKADLTHDSLSVDQILKSLRYLLDGDLAVVHVIIGAADNTVCTVTDLLDVFKLLVDAESRTYIMSVRQIDQNQDTSILTSALELFLARPHSSLL